MGVPIENNYLLKESVLLFLPPCRTCLFSAATWGCQSVPPQEPVDPGCVLPCTGCPSVVLSGADRGPYLSQYQPVQGLVQWLSVVALYSLPSGPPGRLAAIVVIPVMYRLNRRSSGGGQS